MGIGTGLLAGDPGLRGGALENVYWGLLIATYPFISGLVAGSFVVASLSHVFKVHRLAKLAPLALLVSFTLLLTAPLTVLADARQPVNAFELFTRPHIPWSPLGDFTVIWVSYVILMTAETYFAFRHVNAGRSAGPGRRALLARVLALGSADLSERAERRDTKMITLLSVIGILLAFLFHGYIGFVFGAVKARAIWSTPLMPVLFIVSAMVSGVAFMLLVYLLVTRLSRRLVDPVITRTLVTWLMGFLLLDAFLDVVDLVTSGVSAYTQGPVSSGVSSVFLHGPHAFSYLGLQLGVGIVAPLGLWLIRRLRRTTAGAALIALCVVIGVYAMRYNVVLGGQMESKVSASLVHMSVPLTGFDSVQTVIGVFAFAFLLFLALSWLLPWRQAAGRLAAEHGAGAADLGPASPAPDLVTQTGGLAGDPGRQGLGRRELLARTGMAAGGAAALSWGVSPWIGDVFHRRGTYVYPDRPPTMAGVRTVYSACKQCGSDCGLAASVFGGVLQKLDGNPYHPASTEPHARYATPAAAASVWPAPHSLCNRGQAGRQTVYDPYRLTVPLKRTGPRGSGGWQAIGWGQLISEVVNGGRLFSHVAGEEHRDVEGFAGLYDHGRGQSRPIDPADPSLGPATNGLVIYYGMAENGQADFLSRFASSFGTVNLEAADSICDLNRMQGTMLSLDGMTDPLKPDLANARYVIYFGSNVLTGGFPMQAIGRKLAEASASGRLRFTVVDVRANNSSMHADRFVHILPGGDGALAMGMIRWIIEHEAYDAGYLSRPSQRAAADAGLPTFTNASWLVVADPKHHGYLNFLTPADAELGMPGGNSGGSGMGGGSGQAGVVIDPASAKPALAMSARAGELWPRGPLSTGTITVNGVACQTAFQMLYNQARAMTVAEYATAAGVTPGLIETLADEFTSQGRQAVADFGRGATMHTNGFYAARAIMTLNFLIGNVDWMGGYAAGGGAADFGGQNAGARYPLGSWPGMPAHVPAGVPISRSGTAYEMSAEYMARMKSGANPYPARLPWFPFGGGQWPGMFAGIYAGYPYPAKILLQHAANPAWSAPAIGGSGDSALPWQRLISDVAKVPLFIASDIVMSESASYADYVVPDTTYLESWEFPGAWPVVPTKVQGIRQPVIEPLTARTAAGQPMSAEQFLIDVAKATGLSGFGANAFAGGGALDTREDYYLKMVANVAYDPAFQAWRDGNLVTVGPVPDAAGQEYAASQALRQAHPLALTAAEWRKAAYVLARGGRFEDYEAGYLPSSQSQASLTALVGTFLLDTGVERHARAPGQLTPAQLRASYAAAVRLPATGPANPPWMAYRYGQGGVACQIYNPAVATARSSITGQRFTGTACYAPVADLSERSFAECRPGSRFPFLLTTHKTTVLSHSQSIADPWLTELMPEGFIEMSPSDGARLGLRTGDLARVWSPTLPREHAIVGRVRLLPGVRPGVIAFPHGYGHWQAGAGGITVDGKLLAGDQARAVPVRLNAACRLDTSIAMPDGWSVGCMDPVAGGQAYFDTRVAVERA